MKETLQETLNNFLGHDAKIISPITEVLTLTERLCNVHSAFVLQPLFHTVRLNVECMLDKRSN
jgi:hypothetical protein